ncbi:MAG: hypothetical protein GY950_14600 [bacterium]|nr:hypothetical protein [bacterium]
MKNNSILLMALFLVLIGMVVTGHAEEIYVTKTVDTDNSFQAGNVSLREAITRANGNGESDTIYLPGGTYTLTIAGADENLNATGDLDIYSDITIQGAGAGSTIVQAGTIGAEDEVWLANGIDRVFHITATCTVFFRGLTVRNGKAPDGESSVTEDGKKGANGGGIYCRGAELTLSHCVISGNLPGDGGTSTDGWRPGDGGSGGGIFCSRGTLTLSYCTVRGNHSGRSGLLSPYDTPEEEGGMGAGIYNTGQAVITHCTIESNFGGFGGYGGDCGGIYNNGGLTVTNSTISGNKAGYGIYFGGSGGGIYNADGGTVSLTNCTVAKNWAGDCMQYGFGGYGGGIFSHENGTVTIRNTLIADNEAIEADPEDEDHYTPKGPDCFGTIDSLDFNLVEDIGACTVTGITTHNITGSDPLLEPLADNGGFTETHALQTGSPAINAGSGGGATVDQRGYARPVAAAGVTVVDDGSDIGAFEYESSSAVGDISLNRQTLLCQQRWCACLPGYRYHCLRGRGSYDLLDGRRRCGKYRRYRQPLFFHMERHGCTGDE